VQGNGIPLVGAPFDHPIKVKMVENYNTKIVDDAKMLEGENASSLLLKIII
jgi:hypothetical protein